MKRREFIGVFCGFAAAWPVGAFAGPVTIGFLHSGSQRDWARAIAGFELGLKDVGRSKNQTPVIEYRWAEDRYDRLPALAADIVRIKPSLIFAGGGAVAALAAKHATSSIPVVFAIGGDPVKMGLVESLNRPSGNVTGVSFLLNALVAKRIELLRQLVPRMSLLGVVVNPANPNAESDVRNVQAAAQSLGVQVSVTNIRTDDELGGGFEGFRRRNVGAVLLLPDPHFFSWRDQIVALAARHLLPTMYFERTFVAAGGLMGYSASITDAYRLAGRYADRILSGETTADLPVLQASKFEFVINLKTAKALGLTVPDHTLVLADEVID